MGHAARAAARFVESLTLCKGGADHGWITGQCLEGLAAVAAVQGDLERAARLFGAALVLRKRLGLDGVSSWHEGDLAAVVVGMGEETFAAACAGSRAMTLEQMIDYAVEPASDRSETKTGHTGREDTGILSPRECEVASLIAQGLSNREIASRLVIGERTAESHVQHILDKLDLSSRGRIAVWAIEHGLHASP